MHCAAPNFHQFYTSVSANGESDNVYWSSAEVDRLIQGWERSAEAVNLSRNESAMQEIANFVGSGKTAKQVRMKVGAPQTTFPSSA